MQASLLPQRVVEPAGERLRLAGDGVQPAPDIRVGGRGGETLAVLQPERLEHDELAFVLRQERLERHPSWGCELTIRARRQPASSTRFGGCEDGKETRAVPAHSSWYDAGLNLRARRDRRKAVDSPAGRAPVPSRAASDQFEGWEGGRQTLDLGLRLGRLLT